jgi:hypothetical protein
MFEFNFWLGLSHIFKISLIIQIVVILLSELLASLFFSSISHSARQPEQILIEFTQTSSETRAVLLADSFSYQ